MTFKNKTDVEIALKIFKERGEKILKLMSEEELTQEEAIQKINEEEPIDEELLEFLHANKEQATIAIIEKEAKYETKH